MAVTQLKARLEVVMEDAVMAELISRQWPEGASQTFILNAPLKLASGLALEFVNPTDGKLAAFALSTGHNVASGASVDVVLARAPVSVEVSLLGAAAANYTLLATDFGAKYDLLKSSTLINGATAGWYMSAATADPSLRVSGFPPTRIANEPTSRTAAGDINARVRAVPIATKTHWNDT